MRAVINMAEWPTGDFQGNRDASLSTPARLASVERLIGSDSLARFAPNRAAEALFGDTVFANVMMLGATWQLGLIPVTFEALMRAIELNGVFTKQNKEAFAGGRLAVADVTFMTSLLGREAPKETLDEIVDRRKTFLEAYQNGNYARRYTDLVDRVRRVEGDRLPGSEAVTAAVAKSLFKLMAYKDEYEVARLHVETGFLDRLRQEFEGEFTIKYHLAPPFLATGNDARGRPLKRQFGQWIDTD